jgi:tetratricopeptide (TPR) repeat protein
LDDWQALFDFFKLQLPQERFKTSCSGQETIPYFNGGVMIIPKIHAVEFLDAWKYFIKKILTEQKNLPKNFTTSEKDPYGNIRFTGQIAFSLALVKTKLPYEALPLSMNYPYSGTVHPSQHPEKLEPFIIHHHHCIDEDGKLMYTPYRNINHQIDEINSFLKKNREYNIGLEKDDPLVIRNLTQEHKFWEVLDRIEDLPIDSDNASLQYYLALSLHHTHSTARIDEALVRYDKALENGFEKFMIYSDRGFLYHLAGDMKNARKDLLLAFELKPYDLENKRRLALTDSRIPMLKKLHSNLKFKEIIEKIGDLSLDDDNAYLHHYLGTALHKIGKDFDKALLHYEKAVECGMTDFWLYLSRAELYAQLGMIDKFKTDFQLGYGKLVDYYEITEPHIDYLRTLIWKKDAGLEKLRELNVKKDAGGERC